MNDESTVEIQVLDTPVLIKPGFWLAWGSASAGLAWWTNRQHPERPWPLNLIVGLLAGVAVIAADVGHAIAHIFSARQADAPMDEIVLSQSMPRTVYYNEDVAPAQHRMRAVGGPIYSAVGLLISLLMRQATPKDSIPNEIAGWSVLGHAFIFFGSLMPLPFVDGGSIAKWTLVEQGIEAEDADEVIRKADMVLGAATAAAGVGFLVARKWLPGLGLLAGAAIAIGAALGKIR